MLSPVYWNIHFYRATMYILYGGSYSSRYKLIIDQLKQNKPKSVLELCFGDTLLAKFCKENKITWTGIDQNTSFTSRAQKKGFNAIKSNILNIKDFPKSDIVIINGALYHFHDRLDELFEKIFLSSDQFAICEPIVNFSSTKGLVGILAGFISNAGNRTEPFRYKPDSLKQMLEEKSIKYKLNCKYIGNFKRDNVYLLSKN